MKIKILILILIASFISLSMNEEEEQIIANKLVYLLLDSLENGNNNLDIFGLDHNFLEKTLFDPNQHFIITIDSSDKPDKLNITIKLHKTKNYENVFLYQYKIP